MCGGIWLVTYKPRKIILMTFHHNRADRGLSPIAMNRCSLMEVPWLCVYWYFSATLTLSAAHTCVPSLKILEKYSVLSITLLSSWFFLISLSFTRSRSGWKCSTAAPSSLSSLDSKMVYASLSDVCYFSP